MTLKKIAYVLTFAAALIGVSVAQATPQTPQAQPSGISRQVGTVKTISGNAITLTTDTGTEINISVADNARLVRTAPGQKDLTGATMITLQDIQVGDRMLVRGKPSEDGKSTIATGIIVMKKTDIADKQAREREDWQKRGVGGPVKEIDAATGNITVTASAPGGSKAVVVHTTKATIVRRYAPDSIKFDDAKIATLDQIKVGDQLRARGNRSADGSELTAEEIVAGTFRNIAATVISTDTANNTLTATDLATKKPVTVKFTTDSQLRKLPPMIAQGLAMRLKGGAPGNAGNGSSNGQFGTAGNHPSAMTNGAAPGPGGNSHGNGFGSGPGAGAGRGDFNQMLSRLPVVTVSELQKGDAVMIVSTQGDDTSVTAITLLSGVEPILTASPKDNGSMILSPWNLSSGSEGGDSSAQ